MAFNFGGLFKSQHVVGYLSSYKNGCILLYQLDFSAQPQTWHWLP